MSAFYLRRSIVPALFLLLSACGTEPDEPQSEPVDTTPAVRMMSYSVARIHPHDPKLFTEGLLFHDGKLFESTGSPQDIPYTRSMIGISDLQTGKFEQKIEIDRKKYFGEGIVFLNGKLYQLTYKNKEGFIYDAKTFKEIGKFSYASNEGWGMTTDGTNLIMSDGSAALTYLDPTSLAPVKTLQVTENGLAKFYLNELEFIKGYIYANVWMTNEIVKIDPASGAVVGKMDLSALAREAAAKGGDMDVLNGIAYDAATDKVYVTGKLWPNIYQIDFEH